MKRLDVINESKTIAAIFQIICSVLGIPAGSASLLLNNSGIKSEIKAMRKSLQRIETAANDIQRKAKSKSRY